MFGVSAFSVALAIAFADSSNTAVILRDQQLAIMVEAAQILQNRSQMMCNSVQHYKNEILEPCDP